MVIVEICVRTVVTDVGAPFPTGNEAAIPACSLALSATFILRLNEMPYITIP